jgi:hypothetical protein
MEFEEVADQLYRLAPDGFVGTRNARAAEARREGDRAGADALKALRKPTVSAWLVNLVVRDRATQIEQLFALGLDLRRAQADLAGDELRRLSRRRSELIAALGRAAEELGEAAGQAVSDATVAEVQGTLEAALADPSAADAVRSGRLTSAIRYSGLGLGALGAGSPTPPGVRRPSAEPASAAQGQAPRSHSVLERRRVEQQRRAVDQAKASLAEATRLLAERVRVADDAERELGRRRAELAATEAKLAALRVEQRAAAERVSKARRARDEAQRVERRARATLRQLADDGQAAPPV